MTSTLEQKATKKSKLRCLAERNASFLIRASATVRETGCAHLRRGSGWAVADIATRWRDGLPWYPIHCELAVAGFDVAGGFARTQAGSQRPEYDANSATTTTSNETWDY